MVVVAWYGWFVNQGDIFSKIHQVSGINFIGGDVGNSVVVCSFQKVVAVGNDLTGKINIGC